MEESKPRFKLDGYYNWVSVNGTTYNTDIIIHADGSITERDEFFSAPYKNDYFHVPLSEDELEFVPEEKPEKVFVGCGYKAMLPLTPGAKELLQPYNPVARSTQDVIQMINKETSDRFVAIIHIKC